jgi:tetratricopeptide (TPR) repeat protein
MTAGDFLHLAESLFSRQINEFQISEKLQSLAPLDAHILDELSREAEFCSLALPHKAWCIARVGYLAAQQTHSPELQAFSAFQLAQQANVWVRPQLVKAAIHEARPLFKEMKLNAWVAACDWQAHELYWTHVNQIHSAAILEKALTTLDTSMLSSYAHQCRLALANNQIAIGQIAAAESNIRQCRQFFTIKQDHSALFRTQIAEISLLQRLNRYTEAEKKIDQLLNDLENSPFKLLYGRSLYQAGKNSLFSTPDYARTLHAFQQADLVFQRGELDLWHASCQTYLGMTLIQTGELAQSEEAFRKAEKIYREMHIRGLLADNLTATGLLYINQGKALPGLTAFKQAEKLHLAIGQDLSAAVDQENQGKAFLTLGRYQDALAHLEKAVEMIEPTGYHLAIADNEVNIALAWYRLNQIAPALNVLENAAALYTEYQQNASLISVINLRGQMYFIEGEVEKALTSFQDALERSQRFSLRPLEAQTQLYLAETLLHSEQAESALPHLQKAQVLFTEMGMTLYEAVCALQWGEYELAQKKYVRASARYKEALHLSQSLFNEIEWRAWVGLARADESRGLYLESLRNYHNALISLNAIRDNFWQVELASSYAVHPANLFARAIPLAIAEQSDLDVFHFIEAGKANSFLRQLQQTQWNSACPTNPELENLKAEINWLRNQMQSNGDSAYSLKSALQNRSLREKLIRKNQEFAALSTRLERKSLPQQHTHGNLVDLSQIREAFSAAYGKSWLALDYAVIEKRVYIVAIAPEKFSNFILEITPRIHLAIDTCVNALATGHAPEPNDLELLGQFLLPASLREYLHPETMLLISPAGPLHPLPWAAFYFPEQSKYLAQLCIPLLLPSLNSAFLLLQRQSKTPVSLPTTGILCGISQFKGAHSDLPLVEEEIKALAPHFGQENCLFNETATWANVQSSLKPGSGHPPVAALHIASHFLADSVNGKLGGLVLWDQTIYQDQLLELAPLPALVTLSGCSSLYSHVTNGDEQSGLVITCLRGGAQSVIGSRWPVQDAHAAHFMARFYAHYDQLLDPAKALVLTQREFIDQHLPTDAWAGFICAGIR